MNLVTKLAVALAATVAVAGCAYSPGYGYVRGDGAYGDAYYGGSYGGAYSWPYYYGGGYSNYYPGYYNYGPRVGVGIYYGGSRGNYYYRNPYQNRGIGRGGARFAPPIRPSRGPGPR